MLPKKAMLIVKVSYFKQNKIHQSSAFIKIHQSSTFIGKLATARQVIVKRLKMSVTERKYQASISVLIVLVNVCQNAKIKRRVNCKEIHHLSVCSQNNCMTQVVMSSEETTVIHLAVVFLIDGVKRRALQDTSSGSSYILTILPKMSKMNPRCWNWNYLE